MGVCEGMDEPFGTQMAPEKAHHTYNAIESPDVVLDGNTTGSSSVSIALMSS